MTSPAELNPEGEAHEHSRAHRLGEAVLPERERKKNSLQAVPARPDYRVSPVTEAFPWVVTIDRAIEGFGLHPFAPIFLVVFTSKLKGDANADDVRRLSDLDDAAFTAASGAEGFIDYYPGTVNENGEARSYCMWQTRGAGRIVSNDKSHVAAQFMVHNYETYDAGRFLLRRTADGVWFRNLGTGECRLSTTTKAAWLIARDSRD
jgi:hypothetical protein